MKSYRKDEKNQRGGKPILNTLIYVIGLCVIFNFSGAVIQDSNAESSMKTKHRISLVPYGSVDKRILESLETRLEKTFNSKVDRSQKMKLPKDAFSPARNQYYCPHFLDGLRRNTQPGPQDKVLGITDVDLYVHGLNFVFGQAEMNGRFAVISLARLRQSFYGLPENKDQFTERAIKEAVHELGHTFGLEHCPDPECVMHFSNSLMDTDRKKASFCSRCLKELSDCS
jgi:archaemetzincin